MERTLAWMLDRKKTIFLLGVILFSAGMIGRLAITHSVLGGDAVQYFSTIRALVIGHTLDLKAELNHFYDERSGFTGNRKLAEAPQTSSRGIVPIKYPVGTPLMLVPFFCLGQAATAILGTIFPSLVPDGYGPITQLFTGLGSMLYGFWGLLLLYRFGQRYYRDATAMLAALLTCLATPLVYYMVLDPLYSHSLSVFAITAFLTIWYRHREALTLRHWAWMGLLGGLVSIIRYQDGLVMAIPPLYAAARSFKARRIAPAQFAGVVVYALLFAAIFSVQLAVNKVEFGSFFSTGYSASGEGFSFWDRPKILYSLFSTYCGVITRSPAVLFSFVGLYFLYKKDKAAAILLSGFFVAQLYLISAWWIPSQGDSFGNRMLLNCAFVYALGLMEYFERFRESGRIFEVSLGLASIMTLINLALVPLYSFRVIGNSYWR